MLSFTIDFKAKKNPHLIWRIHYHHISDSNLFPLTLPLELVCFSCFCLRRKKRERDLCERSILGWLAFHYCWRFMWKTMWKYREMLVIRKKEKAKRGKWKCLRRRRDRSAWAVWSSLSPGGGGSGSSRNLFIVCFKRDRNHTFSVFFGFLSSFLLFFILYFLLSSWIWL